MDRGGDGVGCDGVGCGGVEGGWCGEKTSRGMARPYPCFDTSSLRKRLHRFIRKVLQKLSECFNYDIRQPP